MDVKEQAEVVRARSAERHGPAVLDDRALEEIAGLFRRQERTVEAQRRGAWKEAA